MHRSRTRQRDPKSWNSIPPTSGPHYFTPAVFGIYTELEIARVVHNLEHGGIYILYGEGRSGPTVEQLRSFYDRDKTGHDRGAADRAG